MIFMRLSDFLIMGVATPYYVTTCTSLSGLGGSVRNPPESLDTAPLQHTREHAIFFGSSEFCSSFGPLVQHALWEV